MFFGKVKGADSWGFDVFDTNFESFIEVSDGEHMSIIEEANSTGKLISGDADGNPILLDPPEPTEEEKIQQEVQELESYLTETDWYAIRYADTGEEIPTEIKSKRQKARNRISELRNLLAE